MKSFLIAATLFLLSGNVLAETITFICGYPTWSDSEGLHQSQTDFILTFIIDRDTGASYMVGNQGSTDLTLLNASEDHGFTFVEVTPAGNVMLTTIDPTGLSVHSRHTVLFGELLSSHYHGSCEIK